MGPILFLYYEETLVPSNLNSKLFRFHSAHPNLDTKINSRVNTMNVQRHYNFEKSQEISHSNGVLVGLVCPVHVLHTLTDVCMCFSQIMAELWPASNSLLHSINIRTVRPYSSGPKNSVVLNKHQGHQSSYFLALVHYIPSWLIWPEIKCTVHVTLPNRSKNQFKIQFSIVQNSLLF